MHLADEAVARLNRLALLDCGNPVLVMQDLVRSALASAPSCIAVIIVVGDEEPLCAVDDRLRDGTAIVRASLRVQVMSSGSERPGPQVIFLSENPGEFAGFAATTPPTPALPDHRQQIVIDGDLGAFTGLVTAGAAEDSESEPGRVIDQAVGVLLDRGYPPAEALDELRRRAQAARLPLSAQAQLVLRSLI